MSNTINLTLNIDDNDALIRAANMLNTLAGVKPSAISTFEEFQESVILSISKAIDMPVEILTKIVEDKDDESSEQALDDFTDTNAEQRADKAKPAAPAKPASPAGPAGVELDSDGLPHDSRIHSRNKTKLAKTQQWKKARGIDPAIVATVEAELRQVMAIPAATTETVATTETPAAPATTDLPDIPSNAATTETTAKPAAPVIVETSAVNTWPDLMAKITPALVAGTLTSDRITEVCIGKGLASLPLVAARPDLIPEIAAELFPNG